MFSGDMLRRCPLAMSESFALGICLPLAIFMIHLLLFYDKYPVNRLQKAIKKCIKVVKYRMSKYIIKYYKLNKLSFFLAKLSFFFSNYVFDNITWYVVGLSMGPCMRCNKNSDVITYITLLKVLFCTNKKSDKKKGSFGTTKTLMSHLINIFFHFDMMSQN